MASCCICAQIAGDPSGDLIHLTLGEHKYQQRVLSERPGFAVIPSLGGLAEGHLLLCPEAHVRSFAELSIDQFEQALLSTSAIEQMIKRTWCSPVHLFEHGNASGGDRVVCSVEHAHLHFVPADIEVWPRLAPLFDWHEIPASALPTITGGREYIRYRGPKGPWYFATTDDAAISSQLLRRVIAQALGEATRWNWRQFPNPERADAAWSRLSPLLASAR